MTDNNPSSSDQDDDFDNFLKNVRPTKNRWRLFAHHNRAKLLITVRSMHIIFLRGSLSFVELRAADLFWIFVLCHQHHKGFFKLQQRIHDDALRSDHTHSTRRRHCNDVNHNWTM